MPTKPSFFPEWGTDASNETTPSSGQQESGWTPGQLADSSFDNWVKHSTYDWLVFLASQVAETYTVHLPASHAQLVNVQDQTAAFAKLIDDGSNHYWTSNTSDDLILNWPLSMLRVGDRILEITVYGTEGGGAGETYDARLYRASLGTKGVMTAITNLKTSGFTAAATALVFSTADTGLSPDGYTVEGIDQSIFIRTVLKVTSSSDESAIHGIKLTYDRPAA